MQNYLSGKIVFDFDVLSLWESINSNFNQYQPHLNESSNEQNNLIPITFDEVASL